MDDILAYLEDLTQPDPWPPEYFALLKQTDPYTHAIQERFSLSFLDALTEAQCEVTKWERKECFSRGVRLGVRLILSTLQ